MINIAALFVLGLTFADLGYAMSWILGMTAFTVLVHVPMLRKLHALTRERDRLLALKDAVAGQGHDVL